MSDTGPSPTPPVPSPEEPGLARPAPAVPSAAEHASTTPRAWLVWTLALAAGLLGGVAGWAAGERTQDYYPISREAKMASIGHNLEPWRRETVEKDPKNTALAYGGFGLALGLCLGLAGGLARRSVVGAAVAAVVGAALGGVLGGALPLVWVPVYIENFNPTTARLDLPLLIHAGMWVPIGAAAGLAFGLGLGGVIRVGRGLLGGLVGAALGTMAFEIVQALAFPLAPVDAIPKMIPISPTVRVLSYLIVAVGTALGTATAIQAKPRTHKPKAAPVEI
jgi:hypothetical protein